MFPTSDSSHNRLLALEQELLGWKRATPQPEERLEENESWQAALEETHSFELWNRKDWSLKQPQETLDTPPQHRRMHQQEEDEWRSSPLLNDVSYAALARRLQNIPDEEVKHRHSQTPAQQNLLKAWSEKPPASPPVASRISIQANLSSGVEDVVHDLPPYPTPESLSDSNLPTDRRLNALVTDDVSQSDDVAAPSLDESFPDTRSELSLSATTDLDEPSYTSLVRVIEEARRSTPSLTLSQFVTEFTTDNDEAEVGQQSTAAMLGNVASTANQNTKTIDVEAHVISDVVDEVDLFSDIVFDSRR
jgi:hypothetical protein